jgi:hypothetical protein
MSGDIEKRLCVQLLLKERDFIALCMPLRLHVADAVASGLVQACIARHGGPFELAYVYLHPPPSIFFF